MGKSIRFKPLLLLIAFFIALNTDVHAVTVDVYQNMENGNNVDLLTPDIMDTSSHGGVDGIDGTWDIIDSMWVSDSNVKQLPGTVTINGTNHTVSSSRTWMFRDKYELNCVNLTFGTLPREEPYPPYHDRMTIACFHTPGQTNPVWNQHDNIVLSCDKSFAVLQTLRPDGNLYIRAHSCSEGWVTTFSPSIQVIAGKTYWVNLHHDGPAGKCKVAVFDPDNDWAQVESTVVSESVPGSKIKSWAEFGRCSPHGDNNSWPNETYSYFSHILIDYTNAAFPLLPDNVQIKNLNYKNNATHPQIILYQNPSKGKCIIQIRNISPAQSAGNKIQIFDLSGRLIDELTLKDGKFIWNTNSVSTGTYFLRLEGTGNYLNQRLLLIR